MNILFVNGRFQRGGAETVVDLLRTGLKRRDHTSGLVLGDGPDYPSFAGIEPLYPRFLDWLARTRLEKVIEWQFPRAEWTDRAFRQLAYHPASLIHLHNFDGRYATAESLEWVASRKPVVWTFYNLWGITGGCHDPKGCIGYQEACGHCPQLGSYPIGDVDTTTEGLAAKLAHLRHAPLHIVAPSQYTAGMVLESQVGRSWKVHLIPHGVSPDRFTFDRKWDERFRDGLGIEPSRTVILVTMRDFQEPETGADFIRRALRFVVPGGVQIVLVGRHGDAVAHELAPRFKVLSTGYLRNHRVLAQYYEAADIFLFAATRPRFPCAILEAMAAQCCVIATAVPGVTEQIEDGRSGLLVKGSPEEFALAVNTAISSPSERHALGIAARERVLAEFSETTMIDRHLDLYRSVLA